MLKCTIRYENHQVNLDKENFTNEPNWKTAKNQRQLLL